MEDDKEHYEENIRCATIDLETEKDLVKRKWLRIKIDLAEDMLKKIKKE